MRWQAPFAVGIGEDNEPAGTSSSENSRTPGSGSDVSFLLQALHNLPLAGWVRLPLSLLLQYTPLWKRL